MSRFIAVLCTVIFMALIHQSPASAQSGTLDAPFNNGGAGVDGHINSTALQPDGKIIAGGLFTTYNGADCPDNLIRVNADGTIDNTFNPGGAGLSNLAYTVILQPDGKIIVGGLFATYNGADCPDRLIRLNADGSIDNTFNPGGAVGVGSDVGAGTVVGIALQPDGKILVGGSFSNYNGADCPDHLIRVNADGSIDNTFNPGGAGADFYIRSIAILPDGKILIGGGFFQYNGAGCPSYFTRLNADGTIDNTFNPGGGGFDNSVYSIAVQADGKILVGGNFTAFNVADCPDRVIRFNTDGTIDNTFNPGGAGANASVRYIAVHSDGKILVGGGFTTYNGADCPDNLIRLNADGTIDNTFNNGGAGSDAIIYTLTLQSDGKIIAGGNFTTYNGTDCPDRLIRLNNSATFTWTGGGANGNFSDNANWGGADVSTSTASDMLVFPDFNYAGANQPVCNEAVACFRITFDTTSSPITLTLNNAAVSIASGGDITFGTAGAGNGATIAQGGAGAAEDITALGALTVSNATGQTLTITCDHLNGSGANALTFACAGDITVSAPVIDGAGTPVVKTGAGRLTLSGAGTHTGATTVSAGTLTIQDVAALGTNAAGTSVAAGASLELQGGISVASEALTLNSGAAVELVSVSGSNAWTGAVTLAGGGAEITVAAGDLTIGGAVGDGGNAFGITKAGAGILRLGGVNTYTGATAVNAGTLSVTGSTAAGSAVTVSNADSKLAGTGTINGSVTMNAGTFLVPGVNGGDAAGTLTIVGTAIFNGNSAYRVTVAGNQLDRLVVGGDLTAGGVAGASEILIQNAPDASGILPPVTTITVTGAYTPFNPGSLPAGYAIENAKVVGNDIRFTAMAAAMVPTLSEWGLIILALSLGLAGMWMMRRREDFARQRA